MATADRRATKARFVVDPEFLQGFENSPPVVRELACRLNPTTLKIAGGSRWESQAGSQDRSSVPAQFVQTNPRTMSMELLVDQYVESIDISREVVALQDWSTRRKARSGPAVSAPYLRFQWGTQRHFLCYLETWNVTYTMFSRAGVPLRAKVSVTLKELSEPTPGTNPTSGGHGGEREHELIAGESLHAVATAFYGEPRMWRGLAACNNIDDPLRVRPGLVIAVPLRDEVEALS